MLDTNIKSRDNMGENKYLTRDNNTQKVYLTEDTIDIINLLNENYKHIIDSIKKEDIILKNKECNI